MSARHGRQAENTKGKRPVRPVTRVEIADHTAAAFDYPPVTFSELIEAAQSSQARPEVLATLQQLPDRKYTHVRQLWPELPNIPRDT